MKTKLLQTLGITLLVGFTGSVSAEDPNESSLTISQWVAPVSSGELTGTVGRLDQADAKLAGIAIALSDRSGKTFTARTNGQGEFRIAGVGPGVYALSAASANGFACYAMHVVEPGADGADKLPTSASISLADVDYAVVRSAIVRYAPPGKTNDWRGLEDADLPALAGEVLNPLFHRVALVDGDFQGQLFGAGASGGRLPEAKTMNVFLIQNGELVARTISNDKGSFLFEDTQPGLYGVLAVGSGGMAVASVEVLGETVASLSRVGSVGKRFVTVEVADCCSCCEMQIAPYPEVTAAVEQVVEEVQVVESEEIVAAEGVMVDEFGNALGQGQVVDPLGNPVDAFGNPIGGATGPIAGGGGFAGGGGVGGGGGLGGLGALAGLGGLAALAGDDNGNAFTPQPVSPSGAADED
ncbi:MAG: carboxypeptidase-like regulatory domain-containing protein [Planctomycetota bacterium]